MKQIAEAHASRIKQIEQLLVRGAKMLVSNQETNRETDRRISAVVDAQKTTERKLQSLLDSLRKSSNGH